MQTEIFVEDRKLDITTDISSLITFAIDDVKDFASRQTSFSKTVVIPGTANNNAIFGNIFEIGLGNSYNPLFSNIGYNFNPAKSARCIIFQDNLQTFKGTLRLLEIVKDQGRIEYEIALNGEITTLSVVLSSGYLSDLDFSAYNRTYNPATIIASWDNAPGSGVYFPLVDYGTYSTDKHSWDIRTFKPALYAKEYIDKMFAAAKFRYTCALFDTDRFKRIIIPYNKKVFQGLTSQQFSASRSNNVNYIDQASIFVRPVQMTTVNGTLFTPSNSNSRFTYAGTDPLTAHFTFSCGDRMQREVINFYIGVYLNGVLVPGSQQDYIHNGLAFPGYYSYSFNFNHTVSTGDYIELVATGDVISNLDFMQCNNAGIGCTTLNPVLAPVGVGDYIEINQGLPQKIKQVDFLVSIVKLFNLYVYEDKFDERLIRIAPFIEFYTGASSAVDWTYKLNRDQPIKIKPLSELNSKIYNFNYKDDSDYYNDLYKKRYNQGYGSHTFDSQFEFTDQTNKLELIFASTPLVGYAGEEKVYPTIFKRSGTVEETVDSVIRIMLTKKITGVASWDIKDGVTVLTSLTSYGYAGHFNDPDAPDNDLNFGALNELFFSLSTGNLSNTQFNVYWSSYMAEITDKDSKMLIAKFYLTPKDIFDLDFSRYIYVDGVLFRLNKITDYNATVPSDCEVQLLKVIQTSYTFPPIIPVPDFILYWSDGDALQSDDITELLYD